MGADGRVSCWGSGENGQLGNTTHITTTDIDVPTPIDVLNVAGARQVHASIGTTASLTGGTAACWGGSWLRRDLELTPQPGGQHGAALPES